MKAKLLGFVLFTLLFSFNAKGQVGVGNTNPQAQLDISASNTTSPTNSDGILIPRMSNLPAVFSMTPNQDGMMVFYTGTGEDGKGFYYWDETANNWVKIVSGTANNWTLNGNAINGTNFFGTTNNAPIIFRTNNDQQMVLDQDGDLGLNLTNPNATLDIGFTNGKNVIEARGNSTILAPTTIVSNISGATSSNSNEIENGMIQTFTTPQDGELNYIDFLARGSSNGDQDTRIIIRRNGTIIYNNVFSIFYSTTPTARRINFPSGITIATGFTYSVEFEDESYGWATSEIYGYYSTGNTYNNGNASGTAPTSGDLAFRVNINRFISTTDEVFVLNENGQLSVGHDNPSATLDVVGDFQYRDGNESTGDILISDNIGNATWTDPTSIFTDDQTLTLSGNFLSITDGNSVNLSSLFTEDSDWYEVGGTTIPNDINDNMYTQGNVGIGENTPQARLHVNDANTPLRLDIGGTERFSFRNNSLEFLNSGNSVFIGELAGNNDDLSGNQNTAIGYRALRDNVTGQRNIAIGSGAMLLNNSGDTNIAIGDDAMAVSTSGSNNISIGTQTLFRNTTGNNNVALGGTALRENTIGINNVALGYRALYNTETNANIAIGYESGYTNSSGTQNTFVGTGSGHLTTGSGNLFLGYQAGYNETGSNKLYISNSNSANPLIYGEFDNDILRFNGNVGIGRTPITNALEVEGNASKNVAGAWLANSDRRLKKNIKTIDGENALNKLLALRGVTYEWNDNQTGIDRPKNIQYGFIAQELMQVFPGKVTKDNLGFYQTAYGDYDAVFVQAIKELNTKIETLEAENITLKQQLKKYESLEARILALENETAANLSVEKVQTSEE
ncbi:tail fiber domain-containing protein [Winogradskyella algicola]|uniref:tail fiber domain-containing protein n=1 Tax=Winogradskyella algicola TaxID=2575815 RepID=UPI001107AD4D|nr:tail fiber domain-containing protein [Winogradskyella algicola]